MPTGRPTIFTQELADSICERLACGESMRSVCRDDDMPAISTVFKWMREKDGFSEQYDRAKEESADALTEDMLYIADNEAQNPVLVDGVPLEIDGKIVKATDSASVAHARLRVDTRKWAASKLKPKKYGDLKQVEHSGGIELNGLTDDQLTDRLTAALKTLSQSED